MSRATYLLCSMDLKTTLCKNRAFSIIFRSQKLCKIHDIYFISIEIHGILPDGDVHLQTNILVLVLALSLTCQKSQSNENYHFHSVPALLVIKTGDQIFHKIPVFHYNHLKSFWSWFGNLIGIKHSGRHSWLPPTLKILEEGLLKKIQSKFVTNTFTPSPYNK